MIDDIVFDVNEFILEEPMGTPGGFIVSYSLDGPSYDFTTSGGEVSSVFIM